MILATYQCLDWETYKNPRYGNLKKLLKIPDDKNVYWCFPANNMYQALINSCCIEPNQPHIFIMFETDNYYMIDKIKWNKVVEKNNDDEISSDLLNISYPAAAEYIVTSIPEKRFDLRLDLDNLKDLCSKFDNKIQNGYFAGFINAVQKYDVLTKYSEDSRYFIDNLKFDDDDAPNDLLKLNALKISFDINLLIMIYSWAKSCVVGNPTVEISHMRFYPNITKEMAVIRNALSQYNMSITKLSDSEAYSQLKSIYYKVYSLFFGTKSKEKEKPNNPCPCGSGKKFKKCCGKGITTDDIIKLMTDGID